MAKLSEMKCEACRGGARKVTQVEISTLKPEIPEWRMMEIDGVLQLERVFTFADFIQALAFTNAVGELAEEEGHHPLVTTEYGRTTVRWWSHKLGGLHLNDFVMAAKTDALYADAEADRS